MSNLSKSAIASKTNTDRFSRDRIFTEVSLAMSLISRNIFRKLNLRMKRLIKIANNACPRL
jgi:hypothetical protein